MKTIKKIALGLVLVTGFGLVLSSCSDDVYYSDPNPAPPIEASPEQPPIINPE